MVLLRKYYICKLCRWLKMVMNTEQLILLNSVDFPRLTSLHIYSILYSLEIYN